MAERSQLQYQPLQGPVWSEPVADRLAWLPRVQQPARTLPPNRLGDYARPEFAALYQPNDLAWAPSDRYAGRSLARALADWSVYPQLVVVQAYDPQNLEWQARDSYSGRALQVRPNEFSIYPLRNYDPANLEWQARDFYRGRLLDRSLYDRSIYPLQPPVAYDPQNLEWIASGDWQPARSIAFIRQAFWVCDPTTPPDVVPPQPSGGGGGILGRRPEERAQRQLVIAKRYVEQILGEEADETDFLESVSETIREAEQPGKPDLARELGALSALDAITHAYNVHFETLAAARAAIRERLVELEDDDLMAVLMILAIADEP